MSFFRAKMVMKMTNEIWPSMIRVGTVEHIFFVSTLNMVQNYNF